MLYIIGVGIKTVYREMYYRKYISLFKYNKFATHVSGQIFSNGNQNSTLFFFVTSVLDKLKIEQSFFLKIWEFRSEKIKGKLLKKKLIKGKENESLFMTNLHSIPSLLFMLE